MSRHAHQQSVVTPVVLASRHRHRIAIVALALGPLAAGLAGCAGAKAAPAAPHGVDPVVWAGTFCGGLGDVLAGVSAIAKSQPSPQGQKDGLLEFSGIAQQAFANTARKLEQLGQPRIVGGQRVQNTAVGFFTSAAGTVGGQRARLAALDAADPDFAQKASHLTGPDLGPASNQLRDLITDKDLAPAFRTAPTCQRLSSSQRQR